MKARKWMWIGLISFLALQLYFIREMVVALLLFTALFLSLATIALLLYLIDRAGQWGLGWAEQHSRPVGQVARRGWAFVEEISKKPFRHPHSETAQ